MELNLTAPFLGARAALPHLSDGGSILTISCIAARKPSVRRPVVDPPTGGFAFIAGPAGETVELFDEEIR